MLNPQDRVHLLGIGGIGISGVARVLHQRGYAVSGSDIRQSSITDALAAEGIDVKIGHDPEHVEGADVVVVSTAIPEHNVELRAARAAGVRVLHRSAVLDALLEGRRTIGVTGTHGKGTVSSMLAWILEVAGWSPGFIIGAMLNNFETNARDGADWMVVEVDESDGSHQNVQTDLVVCNFLELDHLNYYEGLDDIIGKMVDYFEGNLRLREAFVNLDCRGNREFVERLAMRPTGYAIEHQAEFRGELRGPGQLPIEFTAFHREQTLGDFELNLPGRYNVVNAMGAVAVARRLGVSKEAIGEALASYKGMENRFTIDSAGGVTIVKDYNSHPTAMKKVLESARDLVGGRIISIFKPYRYTLIKYLQHEYGEAFQGSDEVIITKMYAAEEDPIPGVDTQTVVERIRENGLTCTYIDEQTDIIPYLHKTVQRGDKVIFFGGDDFFRMADTFLAEVAQRSQASEAPVQQPRMDGPLDTSQ